MIVVILFIAIIIKGIVILVINFKDEFLEINLSGAGNEGSIFAII